jgi:uncharacterized protein (DUF58 family)
MLIPSRGLLGIAVALLLAAVAASIHEPWLPALGALAAVVVLVAAVDALRLRLTPPPRLTRKLAHTLPLGVEREVRLEFENASNRNLKLTVYDHVPSTFETADLPLAVALPAGSGVRASYRLRAIERGEHVVGAAAVRIGSPWRLWQRQLRIGADQPVRVLPNFVALVNYALLATDHRLSQVGVLKRRRRGLGLDFHQLREYREGDAQRQIDWKATSRMGKLISREYQDERDQQIVLLLDCGRRMAARDDALSHMDHVLDAALLLAFVALRQGDAVGFATLAGVSRWVPPRKSLAAIDALTAQVYDLQPTAASPDFHAAAVDLSVRLRKRALVVLITNLRDEDDDTLLPALSLLRQRHLVMVASLRERILDEAVQRPVDTLADALTHAATAEYLEQRHQAFRRLEQQRVLALDVEPPALPLALVNRYIDLKRSGRL